MKTPYWVSLAASLPMTVPTQTWRALIPDIFLTPLPRYHTERRPHITVKHGIRVAQIQKGKNKKRRKKKPLLRLFAERTLCPLGSEMRSGRKGTEEDQLRRDDKCLISSLLTPLNSLSPSVPLLHKTLSFGFVNRFSWRVDGGGGGGGGGDVKKEQNLSVNRTYIETATLQKVLFSRSEALRSKRMITLCPNDPKQQQREVLHERVYLCWFNLQPSELLRDFNHPRLQMMSSLVKSGL